MSQVLTGESSHNWGMVEHRRAYSDHRPLCQACACRMQLSRVIPRGNYVREQVIFDCNHCHVSLMQAGDGRPSYSAGDPIVPAVSPAETPATWIGVTQGMQYADANPQAALEQV